MLNKLTVLQQYFPFIQWIKDYRRKYFSKDLTAGIVVGIMLIPQGMAYAMIAGLPPVFGLYAALLPQVIYAFLGTSRQLAVGPVAMDSILVATGLAAISVSGIENYILMAVTLAFLMGAMQFLLGVFRMGFLVNYLSKPVISGFTSAAAIIIGLSQLKHLLGVQMEGGAKIQHLFINAFNQLPNTNWPTFVIGLAGILLLLGFKRYAPTFPRALAIVVFGVVVVSVFQLQELGVRIVETVPKGLPEFNMPAFGLEQITELLPLAATLALIAFMEAISVAKAIEERHSDYKVDANQELIALGSANMVGSFFQSYPTTGGFSRTAVNDAAGAKTNLAAIISALVVAVTLLFLTPLFYYLPLALLASIIMVAVFGLIDINYPVELWKVDKTEFALLLITFLITLTVGIKEGILVGVFLSLLVTVYKISRPHFAVLGQIKGTDYYRNINRFDEQIVERNSILILRFDAPLFFGNKDFFKQQILSEIAKKPSTKAVIVNAESMNYIDSSACFMMNELLKELKQKDTRFYISNAIGPVRDALYKSGLYGTIGKENIFVHTCDVVQHIEGQSKKENTRWIATQTKEE